MSDAHITPMKKSFKITCLVFLIFFFFQVQANYSIMESQIISDRIEKKDTLPKIIFKDAFDNNSNNWTLHQNKDSVCEIKDGKLRFFYRSKDTGTYFACPYNQMIDYDKDNFFITVEAAKKSGDDRFYYGLMFGASSDIKFLFGVTGWGAYGCWKLDANGIKLVEGQMQREKKQRSR